MSVFGTVFNRSRRHADHSPDPYVRFTNDEEGVRVVSQRDTSMNAVAARHNAAAIYGRGAVSRDFGRRSVIEVRDPDGNWTPVAGRNRQIPDMQAQTAFLKNFRETGKIGVHPLERSDGSASPAGQSRAPKLSNHDQEAVRQAQIFERGPQQQYKLGEMDLIESGVQQQAGDNDAQFIQPNLQMDTEGAGQPGRLRGPIIQPNGQALLDATQGRGQGFSDYQQATRGFRQDTPRRGTTNLQARDISRLFTF